MTYHQGLSYDNIADDFASMRDSFHTEQKYLDFVINAIDKRSHILDIGCGSGFPIAKYFMDKNFEVTGIDGSEKLLAIARSKYPKLRALHGDIRTIELNSSFDAIVEWWCLFHLPKKDHELMIERFASWLKPGGLLQFTTGDDEFEGSNSKMLNQELHFYSLAPAQYEKILKQQGFKILLKEMDQPGHLVWIAQYKSVVI